MGCKSGWLWIIFVFLEILFIILITKCNIIMRIWEKHFQIFTIYDTIWSLFCYLCICLSKKHTVKIICHCVWIHKFITLTTLSSQVHLSCLHLHHLVLSLLKRILIWTILPDVMSIQESHLTNVCPCESVFRLSPNYIIVVLWAALIRLVQAWNHAINPESNTYFWHIMTPWNSRHWNEYHWNEHWTKLFYLPSN